MTLIIPDPRWEEPNLLIPGRKPVGALSSTIGGTEALFLMDSRASKLGPYSLTTSASMVLASDCRMPSLKVTAANLVSTGDFATWIKRAFTTFTVLVDFESTVSTAATTTVIRLGGGLNNILHIQRQGTNLELQFLVTSSIGADLAFTTSNDIVLDGQRVRVGVTCDGATVYLEVFNVDNGKTASTSTAFVGTSTNTNGIDYGAASTTNNFYSIYVSDKAVPKEMLVELVRRDPYQFLIPA